MEFKLPDIGEGVAEGEITKWLVGVGDALEADQPMVEVMTDKATVEIPSPVKGVVAELVAKEGETIPVGAVVLKITENGAKASAPEPKAEPVASASPSPASAPPVEVDVAPTEAPPQQRSGAMAEVVPFKVLATPATRKLARDLHVDLSQIAGTGPHGRVTKQDVQLAYDGNGSGAAAQLATAPTVQPAARSKTPSAPLTTGAVQVVPLRGIRKRIAEAMSHSKRTAAHFTYVEEVDMSEIVRMRKSAKPEADKQGIKLTFLPFIIKAVIPALREFPYLNASLDDAAGEILIKGDYNIGIATDTEQGLIVPVIKAADRKNIWQLADEIQTLSEKARTGKLAIDDLKGGTFTLTNAGSIGGVFATPVINHPEVAILGVNAIRKRPVVKEDEIAVADMMYLSLSVDHRVVDGADAARFMNRLVFFLTDPKRFVFA